MSAAKAKPMTVAEATEALEVATAERTALRRRLRDGHTVDSDVLAKAESDVAAAELRLEVAAETEADRAEIERQQRLEAVLARFRDPGAGGPASQAEELLRLIDQAADLLTSIALAGRRFEEAVAAGRAELLELEPLPDNVHLGRSLGKGNSPTDTRLRIDGVDWSRTLYPFTRLLADLALQAVKTAGLDPHSTNVRSLRDAAGYAESVISQLEQCATAGVS